MIILTSMYLRMLSRQSTTHSSKKRSWTAALKKNKTVITTGTQKGKKMYWFLKLKLAGSSRGNFIR